MNFTITPVLLLYNEQKLVSTMPFGTLKPKVGAGRLDLFCGAQAKWVCEYDIAPSPEEPHAIDMTFNFILKHGSMQSAAVGVVFSFGNWSVDNYVLMPSAVYNGNRYESISMPYPPLFGDPYFNRVDLPTTITDVPRLNIGSGVSMIHQTTGDLATPSVGIFDPHAKECFWLLLPQQTNFGNFGIRLEEKSDRTSAELLIATPCVRSMRQAMCGQVPSDDKSADFYAGQEIKLPLRIYTDSAMEIQNLFDRFAQIRKIFTPPDKRKNLFPFSEVWQTIETKYNKMNWRADKGFYCVGTHHEHITEQWQLGWVGGGIVTHAFLFGGTEQSKQNSITNLNTILTKTQASSGFFYGIGDGDHWYSDGFSKPHPYNMHLIRKSGDFLYFLPKQFQLLNTIALDRCISSAWLTAYRKLADAFVGLWEKYRQFGQFVNIETGEIIVGGSHCGAIVPAGLALASRYFNEPKYMDTALQAGKYYYDLYRQTGITTGGPGEILQNPDSESAFALLESMVILYETTHDTKWLNVAENVAKLCATWCVSYNYNFPQNTLFGKLGIDTTGSVFANTQNKHSAPAICTLSGDCLLKLFRATGKCFYLDLLDDIAHNIPQYLSHPDRPVDGLPSGYINERVNMSDWEGNEMVGNIFDGSTWAEVSMMLTYIEVPGLYVQPDTGLVRAIDNIEAETISCHRDGVDVRLSNPTNYNADIRTLIELSARCSMPLGQNALLRRPVISLRPREKKEFRFYGDTFKPL